MGFGDSMVPGNPAFRRIGPGSKAVGPNTEVYGLINEGDLISFVGDEITRGFRGLRAQAKGSRMRRTMKQEVRNLKEEKLRKQRRNKN